VGTTVLAGLAVILERATQQCAEGRGAEAATTRPPGASGDLSVLAPLGLWLERITEASRFIPHNREFGACEILDVTNHLGLRLSQEPEHQSSGGTHHFPQRLCLRHPFSHIALSPNLSSYIIRLSFLTSVHLNSEPIMTKQKTAEEWERWRNAIHTLYILEDLPLCGPSGVIEKMKICHGFHARHVAAAFAQQILSTNDSSVNANTNTDLSNGASRRICLGRTTRSSPQSLANENWQTRIRTFIGGDSWCLPRSSGKSPHAIATRQPWLTCTLQKVSVYS